MLTTNLVRVRVTRAGVKPIYVDPHDPELLDIAGQLIELYRESAGRSRGELDADLDELLGESPSQQISQGFVKLLEDRCDFTTVSGLPPDQLREAAFRHAAVLRAAGNFDREVVLATVATELGVSVVDVDGGLFADLKTEQGLTAFRDISPERLLNIYNLALAQGVLLRAARVQADVYGETPARLRRLFRLVKFHRLLCEVSPLPGGGVRLALDGPLSLFQATQKYGLQMALFLPAIVQCRRFDLRAELRWGPQKAERAFQLTNEQGLIAELAETGTYTPPELDLFAEQFRKKAKGWKLVEESEVYPLGPHFWVPDYRLDHAASGKSVLLEVLGFWRRSSAIVHLERLRKHAGKPFILAVSDQLKIDDADLEPLPAGIVRFKQMPRTDEVLRLAEVMVQP